MHAAVFLVGSLALILVFFWYVMGLFLRVAGVRRCDAGKRDYSWKPMVSFTVPCFNEGRHIYETIRTILSQSWPEHLLEVIVVDDQSSDDSYAWACRAAEELGRTRVLRNAENMGKRRSLIRATRAARGEICVSVDSDVILSTLR